MNKKERLMNRKERRKKWALFSERQIVVKPGVDHELIPLLVKKFKATQWPKVKGKFTEDSDTYNARYKEDGVIFVIDGVSLFVYVTAESLVIMPSVKVIT